MSNIKRMGVKSIHYIKDDVFIENSFTKDPTLLYKMKVDDIDKLSVKAIQEGEGLLSNKIDLKTKVKGFSLSKQRNLFASIDSLKNDSFNTKLLKEKYNGLDNNNFEIQLYSNFKDMISIIGTYVNDVVFSLNSSAQELDYDDNTKYYDYIGMIRPEYNLSEFIFSFDYKIFTNKIVKKISNILNVPEKRMMVSPRKIINEFNYRNGYINDDEERVLNFLKRNCYDKLSNLRHTNLSNDQLLKTEPFQSVLTLFKNEKTFNYIRILSYIRNFTVHKAGINEINDIRSWLTEILGEINNNVDEFIKEFAKNNNKYLSVIKEVYNQNSQEISNDFLFYQLIDNRKNVGVSIREIAKQAIDEFYSLNNIEKFIDKTDLSEFKNKFRVLVEYDVYRTINNKSQDYIIRLKSSEDKEVTYHEFASEYIKTNMNIMNSLSSEVSKRLGKVELEETNVIVNRGAINNIDSYFGSLMFLFSRFLTNKEANDLYSRLIGKIESNIDLFKLMKIYNYQINDYEKYLDFSVFTYKNSNESLRKSITLERLVDIKNQLTLIKSVRNRIRPSKEDKSMENKLFSIYQSFNKSDEFTPNQFHNELEKTEQDGHKKIKPIKSFLRNSVYMSKQFQYIYRYANPAICKSIIKNRPLVSFVINKLLDKEELYSYFDALYKDFKMVSYVRFNKENNKEELIDLICNLTLEQIIGDFPNKNYKCLIKLYYNVCYLIIKNVVNINKSYFIAIQDYEEKYKMINHTNNVSFDFSVVEKYRLYAENKNNRSTKQLHSLLNKDYIKQIYIGGEKYNKFIDLIRLYRNQVEHCALLKNESVWKNLSIEKVTSYFDLYQTLTQLSFIKKLKEIFDEDIMESVQMIKDGNTYYSNSTRVTVAMNLIFAYNIARFNNLTIEKYALKNK